MIVRLEKGLQEAVELVWTKTRNSSDPSLVFNPSGRIPFLLLEDGVGFEDTDVIIDYFDSLSAPPRYIPPSGEAYWPFRRAQAIARSMLDGISLWLREYIYRPAEMHSETIIDHERRRALRLADIFEKEVESKSLSGPINMAQITLACIFHGSMIDNLPEFAWREGRPHLCNWVERIGQNLSVKETAPA